MSKTKERLELKRRVSENGASADLKLTWLALTLLPDQWHPNQLVLLSQGYITIYLVSEEQEKRLSVAAPTEEREIQALATGERDEGRAKTGEEVRTAENENRDRR